MCFSFFLSFYFSQLSERERSALNRIEIARGEVAMEWESRLMEEMSRLKMELEQVHLDDRNIAINELKAEHLAELQVLAKKYKQKEEQLLEEVVIVCKWHKRAVFFLCVHIYVSPFTPIKFSNFSNQTCRDFFAFKVKQKKNSFHSSLFSLTMSVSLTLSTILD
jgi:hypothetical protein